MNCVLRFAACAILLSCVQPSFAYRPFDSTDAAVAAPGEFELELGPLGRLREGGQRLWVAPAVVANFGIRGDREIVLQGNRQIGREADSDTATSSLVDAGAFIKQVLRPGVLQGSPGASLATEYGVLLPGVHGDRGTGFSWAGIASQRWRSLTVHLNAAAALNREHRAEGFAGMILEGPYEWRVRPVMETFLDRSSGSNRVESRLVGMIWKKKDNLSFDIGLRAASAGDERIHELRIGLTWSYDR